MANVIITHNKIKYYRFPLIITILIPIIINFITMVKEVGFQVLRDSVIGDYKRLGLPYNPWPDVLPGFIFISVSITFIAWGIIKSSSLSFINKRSKNFRYLFYLLLALIGSIVISYGMNILALSWLGSFHDYHLGLPVSRIVYGFSNQLGIPIETALFYLAFILKNE